MTETIMDIAQVACSRHKQWEHEFNLNKECTTCKALLGTQLCKNLIRTSVRCLRELLKSPNSSACTKSTKPMYSAKYVTIPESPTD